MTQTHKRTCHKSKWVGVDSVWRWKFSVIVHPKIKDPLDLPMFPGQYGIGISLDPTISRVPWCALFMAMFHFFFFFAENNDLNLVGMVLHKDNL